MDVVLVFAAGLVTGAVVTWAFSAGERMEE